MKKIQEKECSKKSIARLRIGYVHHDACPDNTVLDVVSDRYKLVLIDFGVVEKMDGNQQFTRCVCRNDWFYRKFHFAGRHNEAEEKHGPPRLIELSFWIDHSPYICIPGLRKLSTEPRYRNRRKQDDPKYIEFARELLDGRVGFDKMQEQMAKQFHFQTELICRVSNGCVVVAYFLRGLPLVIVTNLQDNNA